MTKTVPRLPPKEKYSSPGFEMIVTAAPRQKRKAAFRRKERAYPAVRAPPHEYVRRSSATRVAGTVRGPNDERFGSP